MTKRSRRRSRKRSRKRKTKRRRGGRAVVARHTGRATSLKKVAKRIRVPGETWESVWNRAKNLQIDASPFDPHKWNSNKWRRNAHNCYTYALDLVDPKLTSECERIKCEMKNHLKPQPGYYAGCPRVNDKSKYSCKLVMDRVFKDNPHLIKKDNMVCPKNYYSAALAVHPGLTYHFYKQDPDGYWSHKDGATDAKRYDADGKLILDPKKANRHYKGKRIDGQIVNYKDFCGYFCVPKDKNLKNWQSGPSTDKRPQGIVRTNVSAVAGVQMKGGSLDEPVNSWFANFPLEDFSKIKNKTRKRRSKN
jgi:hypothetical protein